MELDTKQHQQQPSIFNNSSSTFNNNNNNSGLNLLAAAISTSSLNNYNCNIGVSNSSSSISGIISGPGAGDQVANFYYNSNNHGSSPSGGTLTAVTTNHYKSIKVNSTGTGGTTMGEDPPSLHHGDVDSLMEMEHLRPDMVPITVRSELPQLKDITIEKVLCGTNLTWNEFLHLFHVTLDPNLHIVKGSGGRKANLMEKVGDYVKILKRRMKVYLVNIELVHPAKKMSKSSNSSVTSSTNTTPVTNSIAATTTTTGGSMKRGKNKKNNNNNIANNSEQVPPEKSRDTPAPSKRKAKKPKWIQTADDDIAPKPSQILGPDSIEIPEKSLSMETQVFSNSNTSTGLVSGTKKVKGERKKRQSRKNNGNGNVLPVIPVSTTHGFLDNLNQLQHINSEQALNLISSSQSPPSKLRSTLEGFMGIPNSNNDIPMFPLNFSNNNGSHQINEQENDLSSTSSNGGGDDETTLGSKSESIFGINDFDIKPAVVQFLVHKISNKNMLRIREELMNLKNADDYFKLTCVAPLAAGLLEQMFCRNQPKLEPN